MADLIVLANRYLAGLFFRRVHGAGFNATLGHRWEPVVAVVMEWMRAAAGGRSCALAPSLHRSACGESRCAWPH